MPSTFYVFEANTFSGGYNKSGTCIFDLLKNIKKALISDLSYDLYALLWYGELILLHQVDNKSSEIIKSIDIHEYVSVKFYNLFEASFEKSIKDGVELPIIFKNININKNLILDDFSFFENNDKGMYKDMVNATSIEDLYLSIIRLMTNYGNQKDMKIVEKNGKIRVSFEYSFGNEAKKQKVLIKIRWRDIKKNFGKSTPQKTYIFKGNSFKKGNNYH